MSKKTPSLLLAVTLCSTFTFFGISQITQNKVSAANGLTQITYQPTNEDFSNPDRGFMKQSSVWPDQPFDTSKVKTRDSADSLVWIYFRLDNYRDKPIDPTGLTRIRATFQAAREKGLKLVIRFIYNWGPGWTSDPNQATPDAPLNLVLQHIAQIKPILVENADVITVMQAGFVGHWGEWHSSKYLYTLESKQAILNALLNALPQNRLLQLRYPRYIEIFYQGPLTSSTAFLGTDASRIGHHNDCFLADDTDEGTYRSKSGQPPYPESHYCDNAPNVVQCWKDFVAQQGLYTPIGGESCQANPPRSQCQSALQELASLHWSFINNGYSPDVLDSWVAGGCMPEIRRRLGYRFVLSNLTVSSPVSPGGTMAFHLELENQGFASPFNPRPAILVLKEKNTGYKAEISLPSVDSRKWLPGQTIIDTAVSIPTHLPEGTYNLYLWLPDAASNLRSRPAYAIRFANQNIWQPETGFNLIFDNLTVHQGEATTPTPSITIKSLLAGWLSLDFDLNSDSQTNALDFVLAL